MVGWVRGCTALHPFRSIHTPPLPPSHNTHLKEVVPLPHRARGADGRALPALDALGQVERPPLEGGNPLLVPAPDEADGAFWGGLVDGGRTDRCAGTIDMYILYIYTESERK